MTGVRLSSLKGAPSRARATRIEEPLGKVVVNALRQRVA